MKIELSEKAQQALDNIVKILDASHNLTHDILKQLEHQNRMTQDMLDEFAKLKGASDDAR